MKLEPYILLFVCTHMMSSLCSSCLTKCTFILDVLQCVVHWIIFHQKWLKANSMMTRYVSVAFIFCRGVCSRVHNFMLWITWSYRKVQPQLLIWNMCNWPFFQPLNTVAFTAMPISSAMFRCSYNYTYSTLQYVTNILSYASTCILYALHRLTYGAWVYSVMSSWLVSLPLKHRTTCQHTKEYLA